MIDIVSVEPGKDMGVADTQVGKAANILSIQLGALEYLPLFGIDLAFFLTSDFEFQNESFTAYCITTMANNGINVASVIEQVRSLYEVHFFNLAPEETSSGLVAR